MKRMAAILALAATALLLASCAEPRPPASLPAELREIMSANRAIALPSLHPDFDIVVDGLLTQGFDQETAARVAELTSRQALARGGAVRRFPSPTDTLSHALIAEEIHYFFDLLRYLYVGYQFFGGDAVFLPMRDAMLERLAGTSDPLRVSAYLSGLLIPPLREAIGDNHFSVNGTTLEAPRHGLFMNDEIILRRGGSGFVAEIDGEAYRLVETITHDGRVAEGVLPTIARNGEFVFAFGYFSEIDAFGDREMTAVLENAATGKRRSEIVGLRLVDSPVQESTAPAGTYVVGREANGVKIIENRSLLTAEGGEPDCEPFFRLGYAARGRPVVVIDLRGHRGGFIAPAAGLFYGLTGRTPISGSAFASFALDSPARLADLEPAPRLPGDLPPGWRAEVPFVESAPIPHENVVIVLTDNRTASAGDMAVGYLRQLENALFVGTNTSGNLVAGYMSPETRIALPRSGAEIAFGGWLNLRPDLSRFEGVGFLPDLWVPPGESLERVLAFVERYGLARR